MNNKNRGLCKSFVWRHCSIAWDLYKSFIFSFCRDLISLFRPVYHRYIFFFYFPISISIEIVAYGNRRNTTKEYFFFCLLEKTEKMNFSFAIFIFQLRWLSFLFHSVSLFLRNEKKKKRKGYEEHEKITNDLSNFLSSFPSLLLFLLLFLFSRMLLNKNSSCSYCSVLFLIHMEIFFLFFLFGQFSFHTNGMLDFRPGINGNGFAIWFFWSS